MSDAQEFMEIRALATGLIDSDKERDSMFDGLSDIYHMEWSGTGEDRIQDTIAPDGHNTVSGMKNLLTGIRPEITVPLYVGSKSDEATASRIEKALNLIRRRFNTLRGTDVEGEAALSGSLFGLVVMKLAYVPDTVEALEQQAKKSKRADRDRLKQQIKFYKDLGKRAPFMVDVLDPRTVHVQRGADGLRCVVEYRERMVGDMRAEWGEHLFPVRQPTGQVKYYEYWDRYRYCKWVEDELLDLGEHDLPFIPYVIQDTNGTRIFGKTEYFPVLYAVWKGDLWKALNLVLTMMRSNVFALGNPTFIATGKSAHDADIPFDMAGARIPLDSGDSITMLSKDLNTKDMQSMYATLRQLVEESTLNKMVFGKSPEHILAYSTVNMLIQGAKSTLNPLLIGIARSLEALFEMVLLWVAFRKATVKLYGSNEMTELKASDINPDCIEVQVKLKPDIPQDRLQLLNMAKMAVDTGLASKYSARDLAGWLQPDEEDKRIALERIVEVLFQTRLQELLAPQEGATEVQQGETPVSPEQMQHIPPVIEGNEQGFTEARGGLPLVQQAGEPTPEFTESAAENMENLGER